MFGRWLALAPHTGEEEPNHRRLDQRFTGLDFSLVIFTQSPIARKPPKSSLHYPPARLDTETTLTRGTFHDFEIPTALGYTPGGQFLPR